MRRFSFAALLLILLASCANVQPLPASTEISTPKQSPVVADTPSPTQVLRAPEIRFALIGEPAEINVWALFDEQGAGYNNYALQAERWPRLYYLAPPDFVFTPRAAEGFPMPILQDGASITSIVTLRSDLKWTDGSAFSADDVAFTVNAALKFELAYDWKAYYPPDYLERAEALNATTVRFYFKKKPNVGVWQYGVLRGPILQKAYWESKIESSAALLPNDSLRASITETRANIVDNTQKIESLLSQIYLLQNAGEESRKLEAELKRRRSDLDVATNDLARYLADYAGKVEAAHQSLFALKAENEPTLGVWLPAKRENRAWINEVNPDFPFEKPNFDRAIYLAFASWSEALTALQDGNVDFILSPEGVPFDEKSLPFSAFRMNQSARARFLAFNPAHSELADPVLRAALDCVIDRVSLSADVSKLETTALPFDSFVLSGGWRDPAFHNPCDGMDDATRLQAAVASLKVAGYSWSQEPTLQNDGAGFTMPNGAAFPRVALFVPQDDEGEAVAGNLRLRIQRLGIPLSVAMTSSQDVRFRAFSSKNFDMAILGWRLNLYPAYLCEWFGGGGQFFYNGDRLTSACEALENESDLDAARGLVIEIQSILAKDLPFIPLYAGVTYDAYRNVRYPFDDVLGGLGGLYGAPSLALPSP